MFSSMLKGGPPFFEVSAPGKGDVLTPRLKWVWAMYLSGAAQELKRKQIAASQFSNALLTS